MEIEKVVKKNKTSGNLFVNIPRNIGLSEGDIIIIRNKPE